MLHKIIALDGDKHEQELWSKRDLYPIQYAPSPTYWGQYFYFCGALNINMSISTVDPTDCWVTIFNRDE